jgi:hypothetical protein
MAEAPSQRKLSDIAALPHDKKAKKADIIAAEKIIADISSGIYRSPAAALKELVSNAYDADATKVTITTDAPKFRNLVIEDDGTGMTIEKFLEVITHIGGSRKRIIEDKSLIYHRKLIGRIGIGLMAVAQLGNLFYVSSTVKGNPTRFIAEVNLEPFHRDDAALKSMGKLKGEGKVQIGAVRYVDDIPEMEDVQYTVITVPDAKKGLISEMTSAVRKAVGAEETLSIEDGDKQIENFDDLIRIIRGSQRSDLALDGYYYMLWELALLCPINYSKDGPFQMPASDPLAPQTRHIDGAEEFKKPIIKDFKVEVDGLELRRPQLFPSAAAINYSSPDPKVYVLDFDHQIASRKLRFTGYIYYQQPRIDPEEFKGVHVRIRNVGIGKYDKSWMKYPFEEGIKFGQITGEIYVEDGLEPALNIDRDSFRETDVHYQAIRGHIWSLLRNTVFPDSKLRQNEYRKQRKKGEQSAHQERFNQAILQLPAPLTEQVELVRSSGTSVGKFIQTGGSRLLVDRARWEILAGEAGLSSNDDRDRFFRVVTVLASNEMLINLTEEELESLLRALAIAVQ